MPHKSCIALATPNPTRVRKVCLVISIFPRALNTLGLLENISICKNPPFGKLLAPKRCRRSVQARTSLIDRANCCPAIERECLQPHRMRGLCTNGELHPVFFFSSFFRSRMLYATSIPQGWRHAFSDLKWMVRTLETVLYNQLGRIPHSPCSSFSPAVHCANTWHMPQDPCNMSVATECDSIDQHLGK